MTFKKTLEKKHNDKEAMKDLSLRSSKGFFLFSCLFFFLNLFMFGADSNKSFPIYETLLPISFVFFISCLLLVGIKYANKFFEKKIANILSFIIFILLLAVAVMFFLDRNILVKV